MRLFALTALVLLCAPLCAQEPARPSIDQNIDRVAAIDKQVADLLKERAAAVGDLKAQLKALADKIDKLGLDAPVPKPPEPKPVPPAPPTDPLKAKLKAAYDADTAPLADRKGQALDLAALYRQAATLCADPAVGTAGELLARVRDAARTLVGADALKGVRQAAGAELGALLPTDAPLTDDQRKAAAALFAKLSTAIEDIAK